TLIGIGVGVEQQGKKRGRRRSGMDVFVIEGGRKLGGSLRINGSKNAALPLLAAALLTDEPVTLRDVPDLSDIRNMYRLLGELGVEVGTNDRAPDGGD